MNKEPLGSPGDVQPPAAMAQPSASVPQLVYHEGPVLGAVEVVPIYWGAAWLEGAEAKLATELNQFFDFVLKSPLIDMLGEYSTAHARIGRGRRLGSVYLSDCDPGSMTPSGRHLTDEEVQEALHSWIAGGTVAPTTDNTLYFIFLPPQVNSLGYYFQPSVGGTFYGYHASAGNVYYVVVPYVNCADSIYAGTQLDTLTAVSSRELCAAIINPALDGWFDPVNNDIGDVCNHQTVRLDGYLVHLGWSNAQKACAFQPANQASGESNREDRKGMKVQKFSPVPARKSRRSHRLSETFQTI
jgi:hypothetical protein